ncbi:MAG TPA: ribulose-phosphate 3-epimerase [Terriglobia bacterium]|nr:ribulose-phosphate 3-epimerase [Terriglobia bacterium]
MGSSLEQLRREAPTLSVGILTADLLNLGSELRLLEEEGARIVHVDVMDGVYCPWMTAGPPLVKAIKTRLLKDVHLMIAEPLGKVREYVEAGADIVTIHPDASAHPHRVLQELGVMENANDRQRGIVRGVALNPGLPLETLNPLLDQMEMVLLLAVNPGWSGQKFAGSTFRRIEQVRKIIEASGKEILICVDGGITRANAAEVARTGVDLVVAGSAIFDGRAARENARTMLQAVASAEGIDH